ncbi:hypothetical protein SAMN05443633_10754 [Chryseobacterium arachidis]|uniref:RING-type E3 ubiquitin transferase n=1 Tax=Chryseobacterium arachidis TaxID=1416778 RepID=A0A1M5ETF0_9FLAO|nr:hypothetical protein [Chryseobacterium arachidis]SHF82489.1 hypothetical protein SAMN05443633_10754 [Chryseobacterium arachidis]
MHTQKKSSPVAKILLGVFLFGVGYFILWTIFKEKMPFHNFMHHIAENYDEYAGEIFNYLPVFFLIIVAFLFLRPTSKKRFLRLQASLPTSKIQSVSKGLAEIEGKLIMKTPLFSPVNGEQCIGYFYTIEEEKQDSDGDTSYTTVHRETQCNDFQIQDDTGTIEIKAEGIEFIFLKETNVSSAGDKRYTETLLKSQQKMLLVGYADAENGVPFMRKDDHYKILGITSSDGISVWNKYQPLLRSFLFTCSFVLLLIIFILSR